MIVIIDYGMGNPRSVQNMLKRLGYPSLISSTADEIQNASKIILPGVGAFDAAMEKIEEMEIKDTLNFKALEDKIPVLGICLGMQLMTSESEEGSLKGLGWIPSVTKKFHLSEGFKIPHMGWNLVIPEKKHSIIHEMEENHRCYFVHSYYVELDNDEDLLLSCSYGKKFCAAFHSENIFGFQFHPEKSHRFGKKLLENFAKIC